jgi:clan AA aspartic protease
MGLVYADIELVNAGEIFLAQKGYIKPTEVKRMNVNALVDTGASTLTINENIKIQLDLIELDEREVILADGSRQKLPIVGPIEIRFENRKTTTSAVVVPGADKILLGVIPIEDMDILIDARQEKLIINPKTPYLASMSLR